MSGMVSPVRSGSPSSGSTTPGFTILSNRMGSDHVRPPPPPPAVGGSREQRRPPQDRANLGEPVPDRVYETRVVGIGGHRVLVVKAIGVIVADERDRVAPGKPAVGGLADEHGIRVGAEGRVGSKIDR